MPRKASKRKAKQVAKIAAQPKPKRVGIIAHTPRGGSGAALAMAVVAMLPMMASVGVLLQDKEGKN